MTTFVVSRPTLLVKGLLQELGHTVVVGPVKNLAIYKIIESVRPDIFFMAKHAEVTAQVLQQIKKISKATKIVAWYGDFRHKPNRFIVPRAKFIDLLLLNNRCQAQRSLYSKLGVKKVGVLYPTYIENNVSASVVESKQLVFGGNHYGFRKFPLSKFRYNLIKELSSEFQVDVFGSGWGGLQRHKFVKNRLQYLKELCAYNITLGVNHYPAEGYYDRRLFDCMSIERLHVCYYIPGMEKDFVKKKHLVWFKDVDGAKRIIQYYLHHHEERKAIAKAGNDLMKLMHSPKRRAQELVQLCTRL